MKIHVSFDKYGNLRFVINGVVYIVNDSGKKHFQDTLNNRYTVVSEYDYNYEVIESTFEYYADKYSNVVFSGDMNNDLIKEFVLGYK
jgi:hypothetical protein